MADPAEHVSPQTYARIAGAIYIVVIAIGLLGESIGRGSLIVAGDTAATAENIAASQSLWRISVAAELAYILGAVVSSWIFYLLLRPVSKRFALLAVLFNVVAITIEAINKLTLISAVLLIDDSGVLASLDVEQRQAFAYFATQLYAYGFGISLAFFGGWCLVNGYLIRKAGFLPGILGVLLQIAGVCYLINTFSLLTAPAFANLLFPAILLPPLIGESSLALWLLIKGVDAGSWNAKARLNASIPS